MSETGYCIECKKRVNIYWEKFGDEDGTVYYEPYCFECHARIGRCHECEYWAPDSEHTPLGRTWGICKKRNERVHAYHLICELWR